MSTSRSLLSVVAAADNFPLYPLPPATPPSPYIPFHLTQSDYESNIHPLGLLRPDVVRAMRAYNERLLKEKGKGVWAFVKEGKGDEAGMWLEHVVGVYFVEEVVVKGKEELDSVMRVCAETWRKEGVFPGPLAGWRNELYAIYASPSSSGLTRSEAKKPFWNVAFYLERAACAIFGLATFGVHLTGKSFRIVFRKDRAYGGIAYEQVDGQVKIWVPRRSKTKATWPSRLDNSVAGGIPAGMTPYESIVKECDEEASLSEDLVKKYLKQVGVATYFYITEDGFLQPEIEYLYDLPLPSQSSPEYIRPAPHDDEVESFSLLTVPQLRDALHGGEMKPNCGLVYVDWLVRHGYVTPENEPDYLEISTKLRRRLGVGLPNA